MPSRLLFEESSSIGHQLVNADWKRFNPTKAVKSNQYGFTQYPNAREARTKAPAMSLRQRKAFFCGVFNRAKEIGAISGVNPWDDTKVGGARKTFVGHAYTIDEILDMLERLPEPARTVCGTAAITGLSASELRGLRWQDYDGATLAVKQKLCGKHVGGLKTEARHGAVPVIGVLKKMLDEYKDQFPSTTGDFIFRGERRGFALNLDNVRRRVITPILGKKWHGWHGFRRGLGTRLFYAGTDAKTVQQILRHANVSTTMANYIIPDPKEAAAAMREFNSVMVPKMSPMRPKPG